MPDNADIDMIGSWHLYWEEFLLTDCQSYPSLSITAMDGYFWVAGWLSMVIIMWYHVYI